MSSSYRSYYYPPAGGAQPPPPGKQSEEDRVAKRLAALSLQSTPASTRAKTPAKRSRPTRSQPIRGEVKNSDNDTLDRLMEQTKQERTYCSLLFDMEPGGGNTYDWFEYAVRDLKHSAGYGKLVNISPLVAGTMMYEHEKLSKQVTGQVRFYREILKKGTLGAAVQTHVADTSSKRFTIADRNDLNQYIRSLTASVVGSNYQYTANAKAEDRGRRLWRDFVNDFDPYPASTSQVSSNSYSGRAASTSGYIDPAQSVYVPRSDGRSFMRVASRYYPQDTSYA